MGNERADAALPDKVISWLGRVVIIDDGGIMVDPSAIENFCVAVEDGNPRYWNDHGADARIAPPAMLSSWVRPHRWHPSGPPAFRPLELHFLLKEALQLPKAVVIGSETCFYEPVRVGDRVHAEQILDAVGPLEERRLGHGRQWTISVHYRNQDDVLLGIEQLEFFAYGGAGE